MHATHGSRRAVAVAAVALSALALAAAPAVRAQGDEHHAGHTGTSTSSPAGKVGLLLADHGEPPEYNEWTYESFRDFFSHLIAMGVIPSWLTALETGTILYDADCPACGEASQSPRLIDAWLRPHDGPAAFVPASDSLPAHYVLPGGPGFREPDIYEHVGLSAWHEWQRMGGRSPNYDEKLTKKQAVVERLRAAYGDRLAVRVGYGIDPRIGGGRQSIQAALDALVNRDRIESLVVVYHGVGFSDIMQTHHLRHQVADHLDALGRGDMPIRYAEPLGTTEQYVAAVVDKVRAELAALPADATVAVHLSGHGLPTTMCGDYDCGADAYHRHAKALFARVKPAVEAAIDRTGRTGVFHVYGDSGEGEADPENKVAGPIEALDARAGEGWTHVVDVPYEFDSNSRDTLIVLRQGYGRPQPDWNDRWESRFTYRNLSVKIANANGGEARKTDALEAVALAALDGLLPRPSYAVTTTAAGGEAVAPDGGHEHVTTAAASGDHATHGPSMPSDAHGHASHGALPPALGTRLDHVAHGAPHGDGAQQTAGVRHSQGAGHGHGAGGAGAGVGLLLAVGGGAALAAGAAARRRPLAGRLAAVGVGAQLAGLGWDVVTHAHAGEGVHLLENGGHWVAMVGLAVAGAAAAVLLLRPPVPAPAPTD